MRSGLLANLAEGVRLGVSGDALGPLLRPLLGETPRPRALLLPGVPSRFARALLHSGCELQRQEHLPSEPAAFDLLCAGSDGAATVAWLASLAAAVRPGGLVIIATPRRPVEGRAVLCASLLHAGLLAPVQQPAGMTLLTAGRTEQ